MGGGKNENSSLILLGQHRGEFPVAPSHSRHTESLSRRRAPGASPGGFYCKVWWLGATDKRVYPPQKSALHPPPLHAAQEPLRFGLNSQRCSGRQITEVNGMSEG